MAMQHERRRFTVEDYHKMGDAGILTEDDRVELIDGEIVQMSPINVPNAVCVDLLTMLFAPLLVGRGVVRVQNPVFIDNQNEPQPDVALLRLRDYSQGPHHPDPNDVLLLIEVADSTVTTDRRDKMPRYARAGVLEAWIVNLPKGIVEVYSDPNDGKYKAVRRVGRGESITLRALPDMTISVGSFLGTASK